MGWLVVSGHSLEVREEMLVTERSFIIYTDVSCCGLFGKRNGNKFGTILAKKRDLSENSVTKKQTILSLRVSSTVLAKSAVVAVFGLGFIDAGYSGDWSRIGVISKESEELLKVAAFVVVPLCIFLISSISKDPEA